MTQRFFYRDVDAQHIVRDFIRVIEALREARAAPIVVFDHPHARLALKAREHERRRAAHALVVHRHGIEHARFARLKKLVACIDAYVALEPRDQAHVQRLCGGAELHADVYAEHSATYEESEWLGAADRWAASLDDPVELAYGDAPYATDDLDVVDEPEVAEPPWQRRAADIAWELLALRDACMPPPDESLAQRRLSEGEAALHRALCASRLPGEPEVASAAALYALARSLYQQSAALVRTYARSSRLVPAALYDACRDVCARLNVPTLVVGNGTPSGGELHEGEAFAGALVRAGLADLVASEDSDVLLYGVPLLRGLGSNALELVDYAALVRTAFPDSHTPHTQLVEFALLCGTDFNRTVPGIGPIGAYRLIRYVLFSLLTL